MTDCYKAMQELVMRDDVDADIICRFPTTFPCAPNRYGIKFPSRGVASDFARRFRSKHYRYELRETNERVAVCAQWPTAVDQQARTPGAGL